MPEASKVTQLAEAADIMTRRWSMLLAAWAVVVGSIGLTVFLFVQHRPLWAILSITGGFFSTLSALAKERYFAGNGTVVVSRLPVFLLTLALVASAIPFFVILFS
jgi:hypothetical protein